MKAESTYENIKVDYLELVYHKLSMTTNLLESLLIPPGISVARLAGTFFGLYPWARSSGGAFTSQYSDLVCCCRAQLFAIPCTTARQAPLSMGFPRQEYWSELPSPSPGGIFLTQGSNLCLQLGRQILYHWATEETLCLQINSLTTWLPSSVRMKSFSLIQNCENSLKFLAEFLLEI